MKRCVMAHIPLAAGARGTDTGGSRRRQGAVVPIGTKKVVEWVGRGTEDGPGDPSYSGRRTGLQARPITVNHLLH